jgi:hypothetical protein
MNNKFHVLDHPMLLFSGVSETGRTKDLQPGVIGLFDDKTGVAQTGSTLKNNRPVKFAQGSYHTKDALGAFYTGLQKSLKTADFLPKDVFHIEYSGPREPQNEKWILGWDGINDCESLKFECGRTHTFRFRIWGEGVYNDFAKQILRDVSVVTDCCDSGECVDGCPDDQVHCRNYTKALVKAVNSDVEISKFIKAEVVLPEIAAKTMTHRLFCMSTCDNGDQEALNAVRAQYPGITIERTKREGSISTYETECLLTADVPADFSPSGSVFTAICGACPAGQSLIAASDVWIVTRTLAPTDDVTDDRTFSITGTGGDANITIGGTTILEAWDTTNTQTATNFVTDHAAAILAAEGVVITSDGDTIIVTGEAAPITIVNNSGDMAATAVTTQKENYAAAVAADYAGVTAQTFLGAANGLASVQILVPVDTAVVAIDSDMVIQGQTIGERCSLDGAADVAWAECGERYRETRTLCIMVPFECDTFEDRTAEIEAFYNGKNNTVVGSVTLEAGSSDTCESKYSIQQYSDCMDIACLSEGLAEYEGIEPFEGKVWEECPCTTEEDPTEANMCGIRFEVSSHFDKFDDCSWDPSEYYSYKPVFMEVFEVDEESGDFCKKQVKARKIQDACQQNQTGEWVQREYINLAAYLYHDAFNSDPRLRNVLDQTIYKMIDRNAKYHVYYIKYKQYRGNTYGGGYDPEIYEIPIVVKDGIDRTGLETWLNSMFSQYGVTVQPRIEQPNY